MLNTTLTYVHVSFVQYASNSIRNLNDQNDKMPYRRAKQSLIRFLIKYIKQSMTFLECAIRSKLFGNQNLDQITYRLMRVTTSCLCSN